MDCNVFGLERWLPLFGLPWPLAESITIPLKRKPQTLSLRSLPARRRLGTKGTKSEDFQFLYRTPHFCGGRFDRDLRDRSAGLFSAATERISRSCSADGRRADNVSRRQSDGYR